MRLFLTLRALLFILAFTALSGGLIGQKDSLNPKKFKMIVGGDTNILFTGTRIIDKEDTSAKRSIVIGGYVCSYYSHYSDETTNADGFVQFPTMAPRNNELGLNLAQLSLQYRSARVRSNIILHYGDIPESSWPKKFNLIQDANAGIRLLKGLWFDAGFFKTHIGLESIQPRENITSSMAVVTVYEPYFLSGAKLTYEVNPKLTIQINAFDGFNEYIENNKNKAIGFAALYEPNSHISVTYNFITSDETSDPVKIKHQRYYNDLYATFKYSKLSVGVEANYGLQEHTGKKDSTKTASMYSGLIVAQYQFIRQLSIYGRGEYYSDPDMILTNGLDIGDNIHGATLGFEYKPVKNAGLSVEGRILESSNLIFKEANYRTNQRYEFIVCLDVWF